MKHIIIALFAAILCLGSCQPIQQVEDMRIELARPQAFEVKTVLGSATITWRAAEKAAGYAYKLDDASEYTTIEADKTEVVLTGLSKGLHTFTMYSIGDNEHTTNSLENSVEFEIDPTLSSPSPMYETDNEKATITWEAVFGAAGYAYKFDDADTYETVGPDVFEITALFELGSTHTFTMYAIGGESSVDSETVSLQMKFVDISVGPWIIMSNGTKIELEREDDNVYYYNFKSQNTASFQFSLDGTRYGFTTYSGNGGVGSLDKTIAPNAIVQTTRVVYYLRESIGEATADGNYFWINPSEPSDVDFTIDFSVDPPVYYISMPENDPSIVLSQHFDLMAYGADFVAGEKGLRVWTGYSNGAMTGLEPVEPGTALCSETNWGAGIADSTDEPTYLANRNLVGWDLKICYEFVGAVRMSDTSKGLGSITTPALNTPGTLTVSFGAVQFGSATNNISVKVLGGGTIKSAFVNIKGDPTETKITPEVDGTHFLITNIHCPNWTNTKQKNLSTFTFVVENATADTRISFDAAGSTNGRIIIDDIVVRK